jgi:predicted AlkP superfamily phosphohydrolase/phosphomutase
MPRALVLGLDCAPPALVFERFAHVMPCVTRLRREGMYGRLRSTEPPITMPAWASMATGRDPGELGLYGFRNRGDGYSLCIATARDLKIKRVWDHVGEAGQKVAALFVPPSSPPPPVRGVSIGCFLTPDDAPRFAFPPRFQRELLERFGPHRPDVMGFRADDLPRVEAELFESTRERFSILRHVLERESPALTFFVEMGPDRLHHAFFHHFDVAHPRFVPGGPYEGIGERYYAFLDAQIEETLALVPSDTNVFVVSDHGAKPMRGAVAVNALLVREGLLVLHEAPAQPTPLEEAKVDWSRTRAWAEGGYYARVFLNVRGREPEGIVAPEDVEPLTASLCALFESLPGPDGAPMRTSARRPAERYRVTRGHPPDLMVYFDDLDRRALGKLGLSGVHLPSDDRGPDACNHDWDGIFVAQGPGFEGGGERAGLSILDVFPTLLDVMGVACPEGLAGASLRRSGDAAMTRPVP